MGLSIKMRIFLSSIVMLVAVSWTLPISAYYYSYPYYHPYYHLHGGYYNYHPYDTHYFPAYYYGAPTIVSPYSIDAIHTYPAGVRTYYGTTATYPFEYQGYEKRHCESVNEMIVCW
jgi:hypothetical protein